MKTYGLLGKQLSHSFSKQYFEGKFQKEKINGCAYELFELNSLSEFPNLIEKLGENLGGLNVTIPYKKEIIPYLDQLDPISKKIGAVNVIKKEKNKLIGYNSDYFGFKNSIETWLQSENISALILGTGGASEAIAVALRDLGISYTFVSRKAQSESISYNELDQQKINENHLIINTTPVGTYPDIDDSPNIPYQYLSKDHYLFDLVYNPKETVFLRQGKFNGAAIKNGMEMLELQAEESWRIWNNKELK